MSTITDIADAVTTELNGGSFGQPFTPIPKARPPPDTSFPVIVLSVVWTRRIPPVPPVIVFPDTVFNMELGAPTTPSRVMPSFVTSTVLPEISLPLAESQRAMAHRLSPVTSLLVTCES